jgi:hypothetical protein
LSSISKSARKIYLCVEIEEVLPSAWAASVSTGLTVVSWVHDVPLEAIINSSSKK